MGDELGNNHGSDSRHSRQSPHRHLLEMLEAGIPAPSNAHGLCHKGSSKEARGAERGRRAFIKLLGLKWQKRSEDGW